MRQLLTLMHQYITTAIPEIILVFLTQYRLPSHASSPILSRKLITASTILAAAKAQSAKKTQQELIFIFHMTWLMSCCRLSGRKYGLEKQQLWPEPMGTCRPGDHAATM